MMNEGLSVADIAAVTKNNDGFGEGNGAWWIIILFLFTFGRGGFGGYGNSGAQDNYVLASDFATIQRQLSDGFGGVEKGLDTIRNGVCDGFYTEAQLINGVNMNIMQNGYESRLATTNLQSAMQNCCCDTQRQIERGFADTNYNLATQNCATLQAIDKVGDRVIDYLNNQETQKLRDEVAMYRDRANSQYIVNEINKCPVPAYLTCNPNAPLNYSINYGNGCCCA